MLKHIIEIFKTGTHTDAKGETKNWTEKDLNQMVANYNPKNHEAPVVLGHPKNNSPAYGWVKNIFRQGEVLFAELKGLSPEFIELVKNGHYKKRSLSLYPDLTLRHIGFLGAMPPAIKGLEDVKFKEAIDEKILIEFKDIQEVKIQEAEIQETEIKKAETVGQPKKSLLENQNEEQKMATIEEMQAQLVKEREENSTLKNKVVEIENLAANKEKEFAEAKVLEKTKTKVTAWVKDGKILPTNAAGMAEFMSNLEGQKTFEFAEGDNKITKSPIDFFTSLVEKSGTHGLLKDFKEYQPEINSSNNEATLAKEIAASAGFDS